MRLRVSTQYIGAVFAAFTRISCKFQKEIHARDTLYPALEIIHRQSNNRSAAHNQRGEFILDGEPLSAENDIQRLKVASTSGAQLRLIEVRRIYMHQYRRGLIWSQRGLEGCNCEAAPVKAWRYQYGRATASSLQQSDPACGRKSGSSGRAILNHRQARGPRSFVVAAGRS
jgi:hypothetical protein